MRTVNETHKVSIPSDALRDAGTKIDSTFSYDTVETSLEASAWLQERELSVIDVVNEKVRALAKAADYQKQRNSRIAPTSTLTPEQQSEKAIMYLIGASGGKMSRAQAEQMVASAIS